jgi:four helix bundle protein
MRCRSPSTGLRSLFQELNSSDWREQVRRASKSICANLAEGFGKQRDSSAEFKRFLLMAIGSSEEMQVCIRYCKDLGYIDDHAFVAWYGGYKEVAKMFRGLHRNWK